MPRPMFLCAVLSVFSTSLAPEDRDVMAFLPPATTNPVLALHRQSNDSWPFPLQVLDHASSVTTSFEGAVRWLGYVIKQRLDAREQSREVRCGEVFHRDDVVRIISIRGDVPTSMLGKRLNLDQGNGAWMRKLENRYPATSEKIGIGY